MNAYQNRTFIIGSNTEFKIKYFQDDKTPRDLSSYTDSYIVFTNLEDETKVKIENVVDTSNLSKGEVLVRISGISYPSDDSKFFANIVNDSYGYGSASHSYALWLKNDVGAECILRGKAMFVKAR